MLANKTETESKTELNVLLKKSKDDMSKYSQYKMDSNKTDVMNAVLDVCKEESTECTMYRICDGCSTKKVAWQWNHIVITGFIEDGKFLIACGSVGCGRAYPTSF